MNYVCISLIIFATFLFLMGIYVGVIQNKYLKTKLNNIIEFTKTINIVTSSNDMSENTKRVEKISEEKVITDFNKPVIIKSILIEESVESSNKEVF